MVVEFKLYLSLCEDHVNVVAVSGCQVLCFHVCNELVFVHVWESCLDVKE